MSQRTATAELRLLKEHVAHLLEANDRLRRESEQWKGSASALLQSEQRFLAMVNKVPVGIFATTAQGEFLFVNERWSQITGIEPDHAVGTGWTGALHPEDLDRVIAGWNDAAGKKPEFSIEYRLLTANGMTIWIFCRMQANIGDNGEIDGYFGTIVDITDHKRYEDEIRMLNAELEKRVQRRTRQLRVVSEDNAKKFKEISLLYRLSNTMLSTINLNKLIHLILNALTSGDNPFFDRAMLFLLNERALVMQGMMGVTRETSREFIGLSLEADDVLAGRWDLAEEEMTRQRDSEFSKRVRGCRLELNRKENIASRSVLEKRSIFVEDVAGARGVDRRFTDEFGIKSFVATPLMAKDKVMGVVVVDNGISGRTISGEDLRFLQLFINQAGMAIENSMLYNRLGDANKSLREAQEQLIQGERLATIGEMAAGIAHELKNPLVSIGGFARRLEKKVPAGSIECDYASTIVEEVRRLERMLSEILGYSRKSVICYELCNINDILEDALTMIESLLQDSRISVTRHYPKRVLSFPGDRLQLKQVFLNLFYNAQEAMKSGGSLDITVSSTRLHGRKAVSVKVADTGGGIRQEESHNIFNPFYTTKKSGTGLGLPIANRIVANHGGRIIVNNNDGVGVEFNVILPMEK